MMDLSPDALNKQTSQILRQSAQSMQVTEDKVVVCSNCGGDLFLSLVRMAKTKLDFKNDVIGLIHERPIVACFQCGTLLPPDPKQIQSKEERQNAIQPQEKTDV